jgi:hypothetical protein
VGYAEASGLLVLSGTLPDGSVIELRGTLSENQVSNGTWALQAPRTQPVAPGAAAQGPAALSTRGGGWTSQRRPLGTCSTQQRSGGQGIFSNTYDLGRCGDFTFSYETYVIPDQLQIFQDDLTLFDTGGKVAENNTVKVTAVGESTLIRVVVTADLSGTQWTYTVGCPQ